MLFVLCTDTNFSHLRRDHLWKLLCLLMGLHLAWKNWYQNELSLNAAPAQSSVFEILVNWGVSRNVEIQENTGGSCHTKPHEASLPRRDRTYGYRAFHCSTWRVHGGECIIKLFEWLIIHCFQLYLWYVVGAFGYSCRSADECCLGCKKDWLHGNRSTNTGFIQDRWRDI